MSGPILIVDDDRQIREIVRRILERDGRATVTVGSGPEALEVLDRQAVSLVVSDVSMPVMSGLELLERMQQLDDPPPTVMMSGEATIERAVRAVQLGAVDFLTKPLEQERLRLTVQNALRVTRLVSFHEQLRADFRETSRLVGSSAAMDRLRALIAQVAPSEGRVVILGENGTGKELVAAAIHGGSSRADGPFVKVNCAAVPETLVESELFGHEKGAFTGAAASRQGRFEMADGGTLFLDEIGDMPAAMQAKLLRVLQEGTLERVGGHRTIEVDVRVLAATNRDLDEMVAAGDFRQDLLYRLNVVTIRVPPLRDRAEDIPELAQHFLAIAGPRNGRPGLSLTEAALARLRAYPFPGNVRELSNIVERLAILASSEVIDEPDLARLLPRSSGAPGAEAGSPYRSGASLRELMKEAEKAILEAAIEAHDGKKPEAAEALEVERSHFYKKCRQHGI